MNAHRFMLATLLALLPAGQSPQTSRQAQPPQQEAVATIRGVVLNAATNQPVARAVVELTSIEEGRVVSHVEITAGDGSFEILNLPPRNDYELTASAGSFLSAAFGQHSLDEPWTPIALTAGQQLLDVRLILTPLSSITGKVVDEAGKPLARVDVSILRAAYSSGRRELHSVGRAYTDEHGVYYWNGPSVGQFYVRANPSNGPDQPFFDNPGALDSSKVVRKDSEPEGYPTTYYPRAMHPASAKPVDLLNGGSVEAIDITVPKLRTVRISGTVLANTAASPTPQAAAMAGVFLVPREAGRESSFIRSVQSNGSGQFDFRGVLPGAYYLYAVVVDDKTTLMSRKSMDIDGGRRDTGKANTRDTDLQKLSITATRGFDIAGSIRFADWEGGAPPDYSQLAINLISDALLAPVDRSSPASQFAAAPLTLAPSPNGEFVLKNVVPGDYRIVLTLNPKRDKDVKVPLDMSAAYMKSARLGSSDILDSGVHIDEKPDGNLEITIATNSGSVFGRVLDEKHEAAVPMRMAIVPDKAHRKRLDLFNLVAVTTTGRFSFDGIPPGDYKLFAWAHVEDGAWLDPEFLRVYEDRGTAIHVEESGSYPIEIPLLH